MASLLSAAANAQNRVVARGAEPGELYLTTYWYGTYGSSGHPYYDTLRTAVYRVTENGKKLTIQYDADYFADYDTEPGVIMQPQYLFADATSGVIYAKRVYAKNHYDHTQLWVSFDGGKNWMFREENIGTKNYFPANIGGIIYRGAGGEVLKSINYGQSFSKEEDLKFIGKEPGLGEEEVFNVGAENNQGSLTHTYDYFKTYTVVSIDGQFIYGHIYGKYPDVYRGGKDGEAYIDSRFPDRSYKASFSDNTGFSFRHIYVVDSNAYNPYSLFAPNQLLFMSDREAGVFYILHLKEVLDTNPNGWHLELCIEYYRDYGETLVDVYCHDVNKNYVNETCAAVSDLSIEKITDNSVLLTWTKPESDLSVSGYRIFRNNIPLTTVLTTATSYFDENLSVGEYEYYVTTHYTNSCISDSSNHASEAIGVGIREVQMENCEIQVYPNPTEGELTIENGVLNSIQERIENVEIFDVFGRNMGVKFPSFGGVRGGNISHLPAGMYFLRIQTEKGTITKKIIKK